MKFEWHPPKAASNLEKQGISFEEATSVFDDPHQYHYRDDAHSIGEQRFICLGGSEQNRLLMVVYTEPIRDTLRIITTREATTDEEEDYEAQRYLT